MPKITFTNDMLFPLTHYNGDSPYKIIDGVLSLNDADRFLPDFSSVIAYPSKIIFDLRGRYTLEKLRARDETGTQTIRWYYSTTNCNLTSFTKIGSDVSLGSYNVWNEVTNTTSNVRYVMFEMVTNQGRFPSEVEIWGTQQTVEYTEPTITPRPKVKVSDSFGVNGFHWDNYNQIQLFTTTRIFFDVQWIASTDETKYRFSPGYSGAVDIKNQVTDLNNRGVTPIFCLQKSALWLDNSTAGVHDNNIIPSPWNLDPYAISSYDRHAEVFRQFVGYLGNGGFLLSDSKIDAGQPTYQPNIKEVNLNKKVIIEIFNEPDKWWSIGSTPYYKTHMKPYQYVAMCSNIYDKIKAIDPNIEVACAGLANTNDYYFKAMWLWAKDNRIDGKLPFDVINYHFYPSDGDSQTTGTRGISPEAYNYYTKLNNLIYWRDKYAPYLKFWNSEYGYDTNTSSKKAQYSGVSAHGDEIIQGRWLTRILLFNSKAQIDKSHLYWLADNNGVTENDNAMFLLSGIVKSENNGYVPKQSFQFYQKWSELFRNTDYTFEEDLTNGTLYCFRFFDNTTKKHLFISWQGTENITPNKLSPINSGVLNLNTQIYTTSNIQYGTFESGNLASLSALKTGNYVTSFQTSTNESPIYAIITENINNGNNNTINMITTRKYISKVKNKYIYLNSSNKKPRIIKGNL